MVVRICSSWAESDTINQNLVRGGVGRSHQVGGADLADKVPTLVAETHRRMAAEEGLPVESIVVIIVCDFISSPNASLKPEVVNLFRLLPFPKLVILPQVVPVGGGRKQEDIRGQPVQMHACFSKGNQRQFRNNLIQEVTKKLLCAVWQSWNSITAGMPSSLSSRGLFS